jgi:uncharacterized RDD family membrane protein YckC
MDYKQRNEIIDLNSYTLASYHRRIFSFLVDVVIVMAFYFLAAKCLDWLGYNNIKIDVKGFTHVEFESEDIGATLQLIIKSIFIIIPTLYFTLTTFFLKGQTIGKKVFRIRIVSLYHHKVGFWHCLERSLGYAASTLEFCLGFIQATWNTNRMALHDKIAETVVVLHKKQK